MKRIAWLFLLLVAPLSILADPWLENGDFTDGNSHWYGPIKWPADFAPPDPFTKADPLTSQGMIVPLKGADWIKVAQDFKGKTANGTLTISYVVSPDFAFSTKGDDYQNMPDKIGYDGWLAFNTPPGTWVVFISDLGARQGRYYLIRPDPTVTKEQTFTAPIEGLTPYSDKTIALAFPPGAGMLVLHKVQISDP